VTWDGDTYQRRFDTLADSGIDVHGEATFVLGLDPTTTLDAGCGTGRVAIELARRGVDVVGIDSDPSMIATARRLGPQMTWVLGDMATVDLGVRFELVLMAGNVPLFAPADTRSDLVRGCARHLEPAGELVCGFQLGRGYTLDEYDDHCADAGLDLIDRYATWARGAVADGGAYAVSVHRSALG
jgi:SAM-dependent methyltransferase